MHSKYYKSLIRSAAFFAAAMSVFLMLMASSGCRAFPDSKIADYKLRRTPEYKPVNVFSAGQLPSEIRRVALLPLHYPSSHHETRLAIQHSLQSELSRTNRFELVIVSETKLRDLFGVEQLSSLDQLPYDFLAKLSDAFAAEAVLFSELTRYDPYQPISIGLRSKLVELSTGSALWAFDDVFNAGDPRVSSGALKYEKNHLRQQYALSTKGTITSSPGQFMEYIAHTVYQTLPPRHKPLPDEVESARRSRISAPDQRKPNLPELP